jgi:ATP-binding cassette subfamily B protein
MRNRARAAWAIASLAFRAEPLRAAAGAAAAVLQGALAALSAYWMANVIAAIIDADAGRVASLVTLLVLNETVLGCASLLVLDLRFRLEEAVRHLVERELIDAMTSTPTLELHEHPEHLDRIDVVRKQKGLLSASIGALLHNMSIWTTFLTVAGLLFAVHPVLALLPLGGVPALLSSARWMTVNQRTMDATAERQRRSDHLFQLATAPSSAKELRTFGTARELVTRHGRFLRSAHDDINRVSLRWGLITGVGWGTLGLAQVGAIAFAAWLAVDGNADLAAVLVVVSLTAQLEHQLRQITELVSWLFNVLRAAERYAEVMEASRALSARIAPWEPAPAPARLVRGIELRDVSFSYGDVAVLRDVSLVLPAGSTVALVGENGAGKSTLVKLLGRYYEPTSGSITVDGVDLERIDVAAWRARLSGAFQDHARFELVAEEVIGIGDLPRVDDRDAILDALGRAGGAELPARLEHGLSTPLGRSFDDGVEPSGGQWQQLALGRALLRPSPLLLLLDEPTSALDPEAEHTLFEGYASAARAAAAETGAITLLVSHRFSTVRMADLIVVLRDGTVAEAGTHDDLLGSGGLYAELFALQARAYR